MKEKVIINEHMAAMILSALCCLLFPVFATAQIPLGTTANKVVDMPKEDSLDKSLMACIYEHIITDSNNVSRNEYDILEIGAHYNKYNDYGQFRIDSALNKCSRITLGEYSKLFVKYKPRQEYLLIDNNLNELQFYGNISIDKYTYKETLPNIEWTLIDSTKNICGHICKKAEANFRGRTWFAWFSDVPVAAGPWKLNGLPGLILYAYDSNGNHSFRAIEIRKGGVNITRVHKDYISISRQKYNSSIKAYKANPMKVWKNTPLEPKSSKMRNNVHPLFYVPLELD